MPTLTADEWAGRFVEQHASLYHVNLQEFRPFQDIASSPLSRLASREAQLATRITDARAGTGPPPDSEEMIASAKRVRSALSRYISANENATYVSLVTRETVLGEVQSILDSPHYLSVSLDNRGIACTFDCHCDGCPLGHLIIRFDIFSLDLIADYKSCLRVKRAPGHPFNTEAHHDALAARQERERIEGRRYTPQPYRAHPHVGFGGEHNPCMGAAGTVFTQSLKFGRVYDMMDVMRRMLNTYNYNDNGIPRLSRIHPGWDDDARALIEDVPEGTYGRCSISNELMTDENSHFGLLTEERNHVSALVQISNIVARRVMTRNFANPRHADRIHTDGQGQRFFYHPERLTRRIGPYTLPDHHLFITHCPQCRGILITGVDACPCGHAFNPPNPTQDPREAPEPAPPEPTPEPNPTEPIATPRQTQEETERFAQMAREGQRVVEEADRAREAAAPHTHIPAGDQTQRIIEDRDVEAIQDRDTRNAIQRQLEAFRTRRNRETREAYTQEYVGTPGPTPWTQADREELAEAREEREQTAEDRAEARTLRRDLAAAERDMARPNRPFGRVAPTPLEIDENTLMTEEHTTAVNPPNTEDAPTREIMREILARFQQTLRETP